METKKVIYDIMKQIEDKAIQKHRVKTVDTINNYPEKTNYRWLISICRRNLRNL